MLSDEEKMDLENITCFLAHLNPVSLETYHFNEELRYAIQIGKPVYIIRQNGFNALDHLLEGAKIMGGIEYFGEPASEEHIAAQQVIIQLINYHLGGDGAKLDFLADEQEGLPDHLSRLSNN